MENIKKNFLLTHYTEVWQDDYVGQQNISYEFNMMPILLVWYTAPFLGKGRDLFAVYLIDKIMIARCVRNVNIHCVQNDYKFLVHCVQNSKGDNMSAFNQAKYIQEYKKEKYSRAVIDFKKDEKENITNHWKKQGYKSFTDYVKNLIEKDMGQCTNICIEDKSHSQNNNSIHIGQVNVNINDSED